jgi:hypothetical protein
VHHRRENKHMNRFLSQRPASPDTDVPTIAP